MLVDVPYREGDDKTYLAAVAVAGTLYRTSAKPLNSVGFAISWPDTVVLVSALLLVRIPAQGIRIAHGGGSLL
jgi:hypothetical protein